MSGVMVGDYYPVARVAHACDYCGLDIPPGQRYRRWAWVADGRCSTVRAHIACDAVAQDYYDGADCYPEERWVSSEPLSAWADVHAGGIREGLSILAGRAPPWLDVVRSIGLWRG